jgi:hypothetical protein
MLNSIVPAHLAVKAMRDNGYKNAAYAIAELIDNSLQHGSNYVQLLCSEVDVPVNLRTVSRVNQIAILDNGYGMNSVTLRKALQFGNGTNLDPENQIGIGKFGMGLPSSSVSQAKRVDVWSWQNGIENVLHTFLDIDSIVNQEMEEVPEPTYKPIPDIWLKVGKESEFNKSGTLVVWSKIDKCIWKTASSIIDNSELLIGRMYRKFLVGNKARIRMASFKESHPSVITLDKYALPNDPIYLMENTSCPAPFDNRPMFKKWGDDKFKVTYNDQEHEVNVVYTYALEEAREGSNAGGRSFGKHAAKNVGVSILRADRELDLDRGGWVISYDPRERWWGVEIDFPPALDDVFGVTNNKQSAVNFSELGKADIEDFLKDGKTYIQLKEEMLEENDPKALLLDIAVKIKGQLDLIRKAIKAQATRLERIVRERHGSSTTTAEIIATGATKERSESGNKGDSDKQEEAPLDDRKNDVKQVLEQEGYNNTDEIISNLFNPEVEVKYQFLDNDLETPAFFSVRSRGGKIIITLNTSHPAYQNLVEVLDKDVEDANEDELKQRLINASQGLKLLLMAWARYEDEQPDGTRKSNAQDARMDWGRVAKGFLQREEVLS